MVQYILQHWQRYHKRSWLTMQLNIATELLWYCLESKAYMVLSIKLWLPVSSPDLLARWRSQSFGEGAKQVKVSVVEGLCLPLSLETPWWCNGVYNFCLRLRCNQITIKVDAESFTPRLRAAVSELELQLQPGILTYLDISWLEIWRLHRCYFWGRWLSAMARWRGVKDKQQKPLEGGRPIGQSSWQVEQNNAELRAALDRVG